MTAFKRTLRSPWGLYAAVIQGVIGLLFGLIPFGSGPSAGESVVFGCIGAALVAGAARAALMRVSLDGSNLVVHGYLSTEHLTVTAVKAEITDDKLLAVVWTPTITTQEGKERDLGLLAGYSTRRRPNRRVVRDCDLIRRGISSAG